MARGGGVHRPVRDLVRPLLGYLLVLSALGVVAAARLAAQTDAPHRAVNNLAVPAYQAVALDQQGRLAEALPLYRTQAAQTVTKADRLRYASALLRAGYTDDARAVYAQLMVESGARVHGGDPTAQRAGLCASNLLAAGFEIGRASCRERV